MLRGNKSILRNQAFTTACKYRNLRIHLQAVGDIDTLVLKKMFVLVGNSQAIPTVNVASRLCFERRYAI